MTRRLLAVVVGMLLVLVPAPLAHADEGIAEGDFTFSCGDSSAIVVGFHGGIGASGEIPQHVLGCPGGSMPVTTIGPEAFYGSGIKNLIIPEGVVLIDEGAFFSTTLKTLTLPSSMRALGWAAFVEGNIESIDLNSGLTTISEQSFQNSRISTIEIPQSVTFLGRAALGTDSLRSVVMLGPVPDTGGANPFEGARNQQTAAVITVPNEYYENFREAGWDTLPGVIDLVPADPSAPVGWTSPEPTQESSPEAVMGASLRAGTASVMAGDFVELEGSGFTPGVPIVLLDEGGSEMHVTQADAEGAFTVSVRISEATPTGAYRLEARADDGKSAEVMVMIEAPGPSSNLDANLATDEPPTDSNPNSAFGWMVVAIVVAGALAAVVWWLVRRQRKVALPPAPEYEND